MKTFTRILATFLLATLVVAPVGASAQQPACTEYCYDPIVQPGNPKQPEDPTDPPRGDQFGPPSNNASINGPGGADLSAEGADLAAKLGVPVGAGSPGMTAETGQERAGGSSGPDDSDGVAALSGSEPPNGAGASSGSSSLALFIVLGITTIAMLGFVFLNRYRTIQPRAGLFVRISALGLLLAFLLLAGSGNALANKAPKGFYGMMSIEALSDSDGRQMAKGSIEAYRMPFSWDLVQPTPDSEYVWSSIDPSVSSAAKAGIRILPILYGTPSGFANRSTDLPINTVRQRQGWAAFVRAVIQRYGPRGNFWADNPEIPRLPIREWQIWNEENFFFFTTPVSPSNYLRLLKQSKQVIEAADPGAKVMLGGLYGSPRETPGRAMKAVRFLDQLYGLGARRFFDSVAIHPYAPNTNQLRLLMRQVREVMIKHGARSTPLHITEIGWGSDRRTVFGKGSPRAQARQLTSGYDQLLRMRRYLNLRSVYWFAWKDMPVNTETCNFCYSSGVFQSGPQLIPKPAWHALTRFTRRLR